MGGKTLPIYDLFNYQSKTEVHEGTDYNVEGLVYYYNEVVFCPSKIEDATSAVEDNPAFNECRIADGMVYNPLHLNVMIYTTDGKVVRQSDTDISLSDLPAGAYILRYANQTVVFVW